MSGTTKRNDMKIVNSEVKIKLANISFAETRTRKFATTPGVVNFFDRNGKPTHSKQCASVTPLAMLFKFDDDACELPLNNLETF